MHPNPTFHPDDRALCDTLIDEVGFGMIFATTPDGPRVAHTPLLRAGAGIVQFHLARSNALTRHLDGATALIAVNGHGAYVSPRWYDNRDTVPTWNYVTLELEGVVEQMPEAALEAFPHIAIAKHESRLGGDVWRAEESSAPVWDGLLRGITGFAMQIAAMRPTFKLSQNKSLAERARIAPGLKAAGSPALAQRMRSLAP